MVQEGNAGVYSTKATLQGNGTYDLDLDKNATYREYILIKLPDQSKLEPFSSDDIAEFAEIVIEKNEETGEVDWHGVRSGGSWFVKLIKRIFGSSKSSNEEL